MMKKSKTLYKSQNLFWFLYIICLLTTCVLANVIHSLNQDLSFSELIYKNPFEECRVLISHVWVSPNGTEVHYGGLTSILASIAWNFIYGLIISMLACLLFIGLQEYILKIEFQPSYFFNDKKNRPGFMVFLLALLIGPTYDFLIFSYNSLTNELYNCEYLIRSIESTWYFNKE